jgi:uncharacterized membrane protein YhdT
MFFDLPPYLGRLSIEFSLLWALTTLVACGIGITSLRRLASLDPHIRKRGHIAFWMNAASLMGPFISYVISWYAFWYLQGHPTAQFNGGAREGWSLWFQMWLPMVGLLFLCIIVSLVSFGVFRRPLKEPHLFLFRIMVIAASVLSLCGVVWNFPSA